MSDVKLNVVAGSKNDQGWKNVTASNGAAYAYKYTGGGDNNGNQEFIANHQSATFNVVFQGQDGTTYQFVGYNNKTTPTDLSGVVNSGGSFNQFTSLVVREAIDRVSFRQDFPDDAERPVILRWDPTSRPISILVLEASGRLEALTEFALRIEAHYESPMDIEWAIERNSGDLLLLQSRPETVWAAKDQEKKDSPVAKPTDNAFCHIFKAFGNKPS